MNICKRILIFVFVFILSLFSPIRSLAVERTSPSVSAEDRKKFDILYGEGNWDVSFVGDSYTVLPDWDKISSGMPHEQLSFLNGALSPFYVSFPSGLKNLLKGANIYDWLKRLNDSDIKLSIFTNDKGEEDYKIKVSKEAMEDLYKSVYDYMTPLQGYFLMTSNISKLDLTYKVVGDKNSAMYIPTYDFVMAHNNVINLNCPSNSPNSHWQNSGYYGNLISIDSNAYPYIASHVDTKRIFIGFVDSTIKAYKPAHVNFEYSSIDKVSFYDINDPKSYFDIFQSYVNQPILYSGAPLKIFYSKADVQLYLRQLNGISAQNVYMSNTFNNYSPKEFEFNYNSTKNFDFDSVSNNIHNEIVNNKNTVINENGSITEQELQIIIDVAFEKYFNNNLNPDNPDNPNPPVDPDNPSNPDNPDSGTIVTILKDIQSKVRNISEFSTLISDQILKLQKDMKDGFLSLVSSFEKGVKDIVDKIGDTSKGSFLDLLKDILASFLGNALSDLLEFFIGDLSENSVILDTAKSLATSVQTKFPTSIPWDIMAIIGTFSAEPKTPVFELPFKIERLNIDYTLVIDFSKADSLAKLCRSLFLLTFLLYLTIQTRHIYGALSGTK